MALACPTSSGERLRPLRPPRHRRAAAAFRKVGTELVMFGSDYPWFDPALDAARIARLPLSRSEKRAVLYENARRVLGLQGI